MTLRRNATAVAGALTAALLGLAPQAAAAGPGTPARPAPQSQSQSGVSAPAPQQPQPPAVTAGNLAAAHRAAASAETLDTLSRFFAREGRVSAAAARPRVEADTLAVHYLSPDFVAGRAGAPVARVEFMATKAVSSDGQSASLWSAPLGGSWQVVNIATGDDEFRYAAQGARALPGGTVFREPQIDAWYVVKGTKVLPLDHDAVRAIGAGGTSLAGYRARVRAAYGDKLPGSAYAKSGMAGGYAPGAPLGGPAPAAAAGPAAGAGPAAAGPAAGGGARAVTAAGSGPSSAGAGGLAAGAGLAGVAGALVAGTVLVARRRTSGTGARVRA
ncbi:hypothetical protein [Streptomyces sp. NRRL S-87]|uniref:hypothetical protein n=1 Tax=Streptomyces sp. NRRL S-87 TaxID=1463920 RepID=UPI001F3CA1E0|nr:hypothetical protein [Streptomyces sp. NRRL S-87]